MTNSTDPEKPADLDLHCLQRAYLMTNSADPDQLEKPTDLDLHCLQRQGISGFSRTRVIFEQS